MADIQVNTGNSTLIMQRTLNNLLIDNNIDISGGVLTEDDKMGNNTRVAYNKVINAVGLPTLMNKLVSQQKKYYDDIVRDDNSQAVFRDGWEKRADYRPK